MLNHLDKLQYIGIDLGYNNTRISYAIESEIPKHLPYNDKKKSHAYTSPNMDESKSINKTSITNESQSCNKEIITNDSTNTYNEHKCDASSPQPVLKQRVNWYPNKISQNNVLIYHDINTKPFKDKKKTHELQDYIIQQIKNCLGIIGVHEFDEQPRIAATVPSFYGMQQINSIRSCCKCYIIFFILNLLYKC